MTRPASDDAAALNGATALAGERLSRRRAIEALRSGVPNADAVSALGSGQTDIEDRFAQLLQDARDPATARSKRSSMLLGAGFGEGKSHLLRHLAQLAGAEGFVSSTIVISKETPLHDPAKVFRAAVETAVAPDGSRDVVASAADALDPDAPEFDELQRWLRGPGRDLDDRFQATLLLHQRLAGDSAGAGEEYRNTIVRFWSGDPLPVPELRRQLAAIGEGKTFTFVPIKARDLARQRIRFLPRLLHAGGHAGWVVLFDEIELIGRYSLLQRGRSYAELARWLKGEPRAESEPLVVVAAMTDDFEAAVLTGKGDRDALPGRLRDKQTEEYAEIAGRAEQGMKVIERELVLLVPFDQTELDRAYAALRRLHAEAYEWEPPDIAGLERLGATRMRQYVRAWINEWDLIRLDPDYRPATEVIGIASDYREMDGLDDSSDTEA